MTHEKIKCEECGNDGSESSLYLTIDAKWRGDAWELEEREDEGGGELDCLACDHRTEAPEGIFPYGMTLKPDRQEFTKVDWLNIQNAVSNSDIEPEEFRQRLLNKIGSHV